MKQKEAVKLTRNVSNCDVIINTDGEFVKVGEGAAELYRVNSEELVNMTICDFVLDGVVEIGRCFEKALNGDESKFVLEGVLGDGTKAVTKFETENFEENGDDFLYVSINSVEEVESSTEEGGANKASLDSNIFDNLTAPELEQIVQNVRVDAPSGEMPLNAIMLDLAVGHNELEQYKKGALSLHEAVDARLQEEEKANPNSSEADVLREVKKTAFGLYLRIQRGDEELHGKRKGKYSDYFN